LLIKAGLAVLIFFGSDSATQYIVDNKRWDASRALSGAGFGVIATSWLHYWWGFLETAVGARLPITQYRLANTMTKVVLDQGIGVLSSQGIFIQVADSFSHSAPVLFEL